MTPLQQENYIVDKYGSMTPLQRENAVFDAPEDEKSKATAYANMLTTKNSNAHRMMSGVINSMVPATDIFNQLEREQPTGAKLMNVGADVLNQAAMGAGGFLVRVAKMAVAGGTGALFAKMAEDPNNPFINMLTNANEQHPNITAGVNLATSAIPHIASGAGVSLKPPFILPGELIKDAADNLGDDVGNVIGAPDAILDAIAAPKPYDPSVPRYGRLNNTADGAGPTVTTNEVTLNTDIPSALENYLINGGNGSNPTIVPPTSNTVPPLSVKAALLKYLAAPLNAGGMTGEEKDNQ